MQQLSGLDASFLYMETPNAPMHIGGFSIYDPSTSPKPVTFKSILETIQSRIHLARAFRQKLVRVPMDLDHPYWINDPDFDLEFHVRHIALPKPGDWRQLNIQAARLHARELDLTRPLWEMYVIEGLDNVEDVPKGSFALLSKTHHAAIDGVSGMEMTTAIHDLQPEPGEVPPPGEWITERPPDPGQLLLRATLNNARRPAHMARVIGRTIPALGRTQRRVQRKELTAPPTGAPKTRFNGSVTAHRVTDHVKFPLETMRAMKRAVPGATINDAVLATVGGALRIYLTSKNELPTTSMIAMAPISVRTESEKGTAGNQVSAMFVRLGTDIGDAGERLAAVRESTHGQKEYMSALGARSLSEMSQFLPGALVGLAARTSARLGLVNRGNTAVVNTLVTNVPGPQQPLYFAGAELVAMYGLGPVSDGMGLIHAIPSYRGEVVISVTACREMLPDPAFYADCLRESFDQLVTATTR
jgi:WS/DGAT/MGAT family acyltransferase